MEPILRVRNVSKIYQETHTNVVALDSVSLSIVPGQVFGLLGVNGAGKTTLSSLLATLHPATSGEILYKGVSIYDDLYKYRRALGFCPQKQNLDEFLNVEENLIFAGRYFLLSEQEIAKRVAYLMETFEITKYAKFHVHALSGGNKQRVLIARALMHSPEILILDEPTVGLDPDIRRKLWNYILELKNQGLTVILTTHYLDEAEQLSDTICMLSKGKVVLIESLKDLKARHKMASLEDIFLQLSHDSLEKSDER